MFEMLMADTCPTQINLKTALRALVEEIKQYFPTVSSDFALDSKGTITGTFHLGKESKVMFSEKILSLQSYQILKENFHIPTHRASRNPFCNDFFLGFTEKPPINQQNNDYSAEEPV